MRKSKKDDIKFWLITGGAVFIAYKVFGGLSSILESLGIKSSEADINVGASQSDPGSPWSPLYFRTLQKNGKNIFLLTNTFADSLADQIYNSATFYQDNWPQAFAAIKQCKYKTQISYLAERFKIKYGADLITWLPGTIWPNDRFSNDEVNQAIQYVNKLPTGIK